MSEEKRMKLSRMIKYIVRLLRIVSVIILSCTVLLAAALVLPRMFGVVPYTVVTGSMAPEIPVGAIVYVDTNSEAPQPDDVIAFRVSDGTMVTHRVVAVQDGEYITKGDANAGEDLAPVSASQVLGRCVFRIPFIGYLFLVPALKYSWLAVTLSSIIVLMILGKKGLVHYEK